MRQALLAALVMAACGGAVACALSDESRGAPAGVIPYACVDGSARVLLAFDPEPDRRGWGHFGGGAAPGESVPDTAARELREETNCTLTAPSAADLAAATPSLSGRFYSYFAEIRPVPLEEFSRDRPNCPDVERSRWVWVAHSDLLAAIDRAGPPTEVATLEGEPAQVHLWADAVDSLRQALRDGVLLRGDPCAAME